MRVFICWFVGFLSDSFSNSDWSFVLFTFIVPDWSE